MGIFHDSSHLAIITAIISSKVIQDPLSFRYAILVQVILITFWQPLNDRPISVSRTQSSGPQDLLALAPQFHAE